jgi:spermidine/putrescine transport system permease protein
MFAVPDLLGGTDGMMIGNLIKQQFLDSRDWPFGSVLSIMLTLAVLLMAGLAMLVGRGGKRNAL